jgi:transposase
MIVIGVDVHKHSLTAVAVDEAGRQLDELTLEYPDAPLFAWAATLGEVRLWALEDCRHVTGALERQLIAAGEELVRVPPKLTGAARRAGRCAASRTRSMHSRSHGSRCASRASIGLVSARSATTISSCW